MLRDRLSVELILRRFVDLGARGSGRDDESSSAVNSYQAAGVVQW